MRPKIGRHDGTRVVFDGDIKIRERVERKVASIERQYRAYVTRHPNARDMIAWFLKQREQARDLVSPRLVRSPFLSLATRRKR